MDEEQKKWSDQYSKSFGVEEFLRFGCVFFIWQAIGIGLTIWSGNLGYFLMCMAIYFSLPTLTAYWQPAYSLVRIIFGNPDIPPKLISHKRNWWNYVPLIIRLVISAALLFKGIEFLIR